MAKIFALATASLDGTAMPSPLVARTPGRGGYNSISELSIDFESTGGWLKWAQ